MTASGPPGYVPPGSLVWFFGPIPPLGYLLCDGSTVSKYDYPALFQVLGTTYGPADADAFTLPNLLGTFVRGWNNGGSGPDVGRVFGSIQFQSTSTPTTPINIVGTTQEAGNHSHVITVNTGDYVANYRNVRGVVALPWFQQTTSDRVGAGDVNLENPASQGNPAIQTAGVHSHNINALATLTGGDPETRPYNIALLPCVKY